MPKASKPGYYAVRIGRVPGIYLSWTDCEAQVKGFTGALYKKLSTVAEANEFMAARTSAVRTSPPVPSTSRAAVVPEPNIPTRTVQADHSTHEGERDCDIVYCDGACKGNGRVGSVAGVGVWWGHGDRRNISERCPGDQTNNRAELIAIVRILETAPRLNRRLLIKTDSKYSIQCVSLWIFKWMRNGFQTADGKPVKNRALIKYLAALLHMRRKTHQIIEFKHVRGHVGIEGNEAADQLANLGTTKPVVPERDWEKLEKEMFQSLKPGKPVQVVDDDPKAYADGLLDDDELTESADASIGNIKLPVQAPGREHLGNKNSAGRSRTSASLPVQHEVSPPPISVAGLVAARPSGRTKLPSGDTSGPTSMTTLALASAPCQKPTSTTISKEELEVFASCLLGDEELSALGRDGVFGSE